MRPIGWIAEGGRSVGYAQEWRAIVDGPLPELLAFMVDEGEHARALRQSTPFAGLIDPRERWRIWAEVRERFEGAAGVGIVRDGDPETR